MYQTALSPSPWTRASLVGFALPSLVAPLRCSASRRMGVARNGLVARLDHDPSPFANCRSIAGHWGQKRGSFFYNHLARNLAKAVGPCYFRFGGTAEDFTAYNFSRQAPPETNMYTINSSVFTGLVDFAEAAGWNLIFGANVGTHRYAGNNTWNPAQFESLQEFVASQHQWSPLAGWELGNEPDLFPEHHNFTVTPQALANDFGVYRRVVAKHQPSSLIIGPDTAKMEGDFFGLFVKEAVRTHAIDVATWHFYYGPGSSRPQCVPNPLVLDGCIASITRVLTLKEEPGRCSPRFLPLAPQRFNAFGLFTPRHP